MGFAQGASAPASGWVLRGVLCRLPTFRRRTSPVSQRTSSLTPDGASPYLPTVPAHFNVRPIPSSTLRPCKFKTCLAHAFGRGFSPALLRRMQCGCAWQMSPTAMQTQLASAKQAGGLLPRYDRCGVSHLYV
jgi:hypothetical protein